MSILYDVVSLVNVFIYRVQPGAIVYRIEEIFYKSMINIGWLLLMIRNK